MPRKAELPQPPDAKAKKVETQTRYMSRLRGFRAEALSLRDRVDLLEAQVGTLLTILGRADREPESVK